GDRNPAARGARRSVVRPESGRDPDGPRVGARDPARGPGPLARSSRLLASLSDPVADRPGHPRRTIGRPARRATSGEPMTNDAPEEGRSMLRIYVLAMAGV